MPPSAPATIVLVTLHARRSAQAVPLAAASVAAALPEKLRTRTRLLDLFPEDSETAALQKILALSPGLVAFPLYSWSRSRSLALARRLRQTDPRLLLAAGGPEATADPEGVLEEGELDAVIRGEGELSFRDLASDFAAGRPPAPHPGVSLRYDRRIVHGPERPPVEDLGELPSPWLAGALQVPADGGALWEIARGCPFACDFCYDARGSHGVRSIPHERLNAELDELLRRKVAQVWVLDSTFNCPPRRGKTLLRLLVEKAPQIHFHLEAKAEFLDKETAVLLSRLACSVQIGLQSAHPEVLRQIHRTLDREAFARQVHLLAAEGVTYGLDLIYGLPGDDETGFAESLDFALALAPNHLDIFPLAVLPGTPLHRDRETLGIEAMDRPPYEVIATPTLSQTAMEHCRRLAAATDIFYNAGRAVGFFGSLLRVTEEAPSRFLRNFADWALERQQIARERFFDIHQWQPQDLLDLQQRYVSDKLREIGRTELLQAARDLLRYHFHYAETLLGPETPAQPGSIRRDPWRSAWQLAPGVRLVDFAYEILDLLEMGEVDIAQFATLFRPVGSTALFARRGDQVLCESLEEDFARLLQGCDGQRTPQEIFGDIISAREGAEIAEFAVAEGLLVEPPSPNRRRGRR